MNATTADILKIERAYSDTHGFIGYRLLLGGESMLIWQNQDTLVGFRYGRQFVPVCRERITYVPCDLIESR